ncbi:MAG: HAMP domain-containing protein [bacterium]|nr:HAMP domain-containing protein [bacterium]
MSVGNLLFELYLNSDFADQLKDRTKGDIVIVSGKEQLGSTFQDDEGRRFYPEIPAVPEGKTATLEVFEKHHLAGGIPIIDFSKKTIGHIFTVVNIHDIIEAKKHGVTSILLVLLVVVVFVILLSLFIGQKLTGSILKLSQGAEALARGEFDLQLESNSKDEIGQLTRVFNKMTESLKAQREEILDLKLFFEKIIENSPSAIIICDIVSNAITINPAAEQLFNVSVDDVKGKEIFDVINLPPSLQADFYQVILSGNPSSYDSYRLALGEHEEKIFRLTFYEVSLKNSMSVAIQIEDITESLRLEEELTHAQKLGTLGEVLGRFTHEFNNLMAGIVGNVSLMKRSVKAEDNNFKRVRVIEDLAHRAQELGKNVLSFSKKEKMVTSRVEVRKLIDNVLGLVEKTVLKTIAVEKQYDTGPFPIMANMEKLSLALLNLLINARDAVKECKQPIICISVAHKEAESIAVTEIRVSDNGTGIDEKIAAKIFEPYFTTKGKKGTGLGLATVKDIVEKSGGKISVESVMGIGTTFVMRFPDVD